MQLIEGFPRSTGFIVIPDRELDLAMTLDLAQGHNIDNALRDIYSVLYKAIRCQH